MRSFAGSLLVGLTLSAKGNLRIRAGTARGAFKQMRHGTSGLRPRTLEALVACLLPGLASAFLCAWLIKSTGLLVTTCIRAQLIRGVPSELCPAWRPLPTRMMCRGAFVDTWLILQDDMLNRLPSLPRVTLQRLQMHPLQQRLRRWLCPRATAPDREAAADEMARPGQDCCQTAGITELLAL